MSVSQARWAAMVAESCLVIRPSPRPSAPIWFSTASIRAAWPSNVTSGPGCPPVT